MSCLNKMSRQFLSIFFWGSTCWGIPSYKSEYTVMNNQSITIEQNLQSNGKYFAFSLLFCAKSCHRRFWTVSCEVLYKKIAVNRKLERVVELDIILSQWNKHFVFNSQHLDQQSHPQYQPCRLIDEPEHTYTFKHVW